ncbi:hypothetical protein N7495_007430 [Penicillium taxi]|uniref:uncharacterized protein n=1 Tax=Penicillium taxi TaxID=168475 RepID=UPI00254559B4|nr:uncharacterized protein N7495_007430 [Penicillium taxi]KAJ5887389.1 hypothetical protein N7495_007430 [Penicillium taxi]
MATVSLHITSEVARNSDLFGLLGDVPVQRIDVDNEARLREFEVLWRENALQKELVMQTLFEALFES